jgi:hypothetical protein
VRALVLRHGWRVGLAAWLAWSAVDAFALLPAFRALPALYRAALNL